MKLLEPIIDNDIHPLLDPERIMAYLPEPWRSRLASGNSGPGHIGYWNPHGVRRIDALLPDGRRVESDPRLLAREFLDPYGISYGILNVDVINFTLAPEPDFAAAMCSAVNDVIVNEWLPADPRLRAAILVSPVDPLLAAREIHRLGDHPGVVQVLMPSGARMPYGQRYYDPIYAAAVAHQLPVAIHPGTEGVGISGPPSAAGYPGSYFEWHTGLVGSYIAHLLSLVCEGTFQKFPDLRFVLIEGGVAWLPPILWRFDKNWKALRQTTPWLTRPPSAIVRDHIKITTQPIEEPDHPGHLTAMLEMFDAAHMLIFASDYPHWDGDTPDFAGRVFDAALRRRVFSETARELYGLPEVVHG